MQNLAQKYGPLDVQKYVGFFFFKILLTFLAVRHLSSPPKDQIFTLCFEGWGLNHWITREVPYIGVLQRPLWMSNSHIFLFKSLTSAYSDNCEVK